MLKEGYSQAAYDKFITDGKSATLKAQGGSYGGGSETLIVEGMDGYNATLTGDKSSTFGVNCGMSTGRNGVVAVDCRNGAEADNTGALQSVAAHSLNGNNTIRCDAIVRRLTPLECERLQGFFDFWTVLSPIEDMSEAEYAFWITLLFEKAIREGKARQNAEGEYLIWREVKFENEEGEIEVVWENTHKPYKHKTKAQIIKWYNKSFTEDADSARYKALGNSIAIPPWFYVLQKLSLCCGTDHNMASLFDGIGGFPLIWEMLNGTGSCLWASEIEDFPIAVTKVRFPEEVHT